MKDIISKKTRNSFKEYLVEFCVLRTIKEYFENHNIVIVDELNEEEKSKRRPLIDKYYSLINWESYESIKKIISVYEDILIDLELSNQASDTRYQVLDTYYRQLISYLERDGYSFVKNRLISKENNNLTLIDEVLTEGNFGTYVERIKSSIKTDPALAIGSTKELLEATLKTILDKTNSEYDRNDDIPKLLKKVQLQLNLVPKDVKDDKKGSEMIKTTLQSIGQIVIKIAELRNLYGSGHGDSKSNKGLTQRHAKLVVGTGIALATFLLDTLEMQKSQTT